MTALNRSFVILFSVLAIMIAVPAFSFSQTTSPQATTIDFEDQSGPQLFGTAGPPLTTSSVTFSGGQILTNATYLPADGTSVYGTADFCSGCSPTMTIDFQQKASNVSFLLLNGEYFTVTYTVEDDQGSTQQISLVANASNGAATVTLPDSGIRQVQISSDPSQWDFEIDNVSFSTDGAQLLDPVDSGFLIEYAGGDSITTDTDVLATGGTLVIGAVADGVTQLLIRIPATNAGDTFNLSLVDEKGVAADVINNGGLFKLGDDPSTAAAGLAVTSVDTAQGPMAFAVFLAPADFERGPDDSSLFSRNLTLNIQAGSITSAIRRANGTTPGTTNTIAALRHPLFLIHGLWADTTSWAQFQAAVASQPFGAPNNVHLVDYSMPVSGVTKTSPSYLGTDSKLVSVRINALGFDYIAQQIANPLLDEIKSSSRQYDVGGGHADVVAHSMGGDVALELAKADGFKSKKISNGPIGRLITVATPYLGSPLATDLLNGESMCAAGTLASLGGEPSFANVTINSNQQIFGAVYELEPGSDALNTLQSGSLPFPIAYIGGSSNATNWTNLNGLPISKSVHRVCNSDVIGAALTPTGWMSLFPGASDSVVTVLSQANGNLANLSTIVPGVVHSKGITVLNFNPPFELGDTDIFNAIFDLLRANPGDGRFHVKGQF